MSAIPVSDLLSTVRIIAGSTAEIAAASIGDQHLVATVRLAEEEHSVETLNGVKIPDVKVLVPEEEVELSASEKAIDETDEKRADAEGEELEERPAADYEKTEANNPVEMEVTGEHPASLEDASDELSGEIENDLALEEPASSVVMPSDDDSISGVEDVTLATVEEGKESCHETDGLEDFTEPSTALELDLHATAGVAGEDDVSETVVDAVEEVEPAEATEKGI